MSKQNAAGAAPQENKMGVLPVGKLLAGMAVPMMISMLVQALYNIVDSVFVSRLSENAFNAVGLAFPPPEPDDRRGRGHCRGHQRTAFPLSG